MPTSTTLSVNSQKGAIPLIALVAIGVASLIGGTYAIKSELLKIDKGEISLDLTKIQRQQSAPKSTPQTQSKSTDQQAAKPTPSPQLAPNKVTVQADTDKDQPGFSINPPAGWNQVSKAGFAAYFQAPEKDEAEVEGVKGGTQNSAATVQIRFLPFNYTQLKESGLSESQILDEATKEVKKSMEPVAPTYLTDRRTTFAGQDAQLLEAKVKIKLNASQIEEYKDLSGMYWDVRAYGYYLVKGNYLAAAVSTSLDNAWGKRAPAIQASLNSFKFLDESLTSQPTPSPATTAQPTPQSQITSTSSPMEISNYNIVFGSAEEISNRNPYKLKPPIAFSMKEPTNWKKGVPSFTDQKSYSVEYEGEEESQSGKNSNILRVRPIIAVTMTYYTGGELYWAENKIKSSGKAKEGTFFGKKGYFYDRTSEDYKTGLLIRTQSYVFYENNYQIEISISSMDATWDKWAPSMKKVIDSFKFL